MDKYNDTLLLSKQHLKELIKEYDWYEKFYKERKKVLKLNLKAYDEYIKFIHSYHKQEK